MDSPQRIVLLGATAYTGRLIAEELKEAKIEFAIAGRNNLALLELQIELRIAARPIICDLKNDRDIENLLNQTDLLINCVGPFNLYAKPLLNKIAKKGIVYLDITGEQEIVKNSFEKLHKTALTNQSLIVHSCSFESCLVDILAFEKLSSQTEYDGIYSIYSFSKSSPSPGTRFTMQLAKHFPAYQLVKGKLELCKPMAKSISIEKENLKIETAGFAPYPEVLFLKNRYQVKNCSSYISMAAEEIKLSLSSPIKTLDEIVKRQKKAISKGPSEEERKQQEFSILLISKTLDQKIEAFEMRGKDMYSLTAKIVLHFIKSILKNPPKSRGVRNPSEIIDGKNLLQDLQINGLIQVEKIPNINNIVEFNSAHL